MYMFFVFIILALLFNWWQWDLLFVSGSYFPSLAVSWLWRTTAVTYLKPNFTKIQTLNTAQQYRDKNKATTPHCTSQSSKEVVIITLRPCCVIPADGGYSSQLCPPQSDSYPGASSRSGRTLNLIIDPRLAAWLAQWLAGTVTSKSGIVSSQSTEEEFLQKGWCWYNNNSFSVFIDNLILLQQILVLLHLSSDWKLIDVGSHLTFPQWCYLVLPLTALTSLYKPPSHVNILARTTPCAVCVHNCVRIIR